MKRTPTTKRKLVAPLQNPTDFETLLLGAMGQSTKRIMRDTGYTPCQVTYRLAKYGIKRMDFRNGDSELSYVIMKISRPIASKLIRTQYFHTQ